MKAVQLIAFDNNKNPYIPNQALVVLKTLNTTNLHIISVAGKYRTGKSYILNRVLLNRNQGFNVGHTINACTKGLWMWPELIKLNDKDCLIIDTEGLGSLEEGESTDLKIFMLALLFSSQLIYNSLGSIDEQALESLSLVIQLATLLQRQDKYDTQELVNTFPSFMWLIRDFSLKLQNEKGVPITPQEYLEQALRHQSRTSQAAQRKNQIRKQLRTFFQERDCYALVRPTEQEKDLHNLSSVADSKLRPEFVALIGGLKQRLSESVKPKRVRGRVLSMEGFIELCQYYTKALVDGKLPTISSHWDNLCLSETHRIFQKYQLQHLKALQSLEGDFQQIANVHRLIVKEGMEAIQRSFLGKLEKQLFKERFERKLESQLQEIKERANWKKSREVKLMLETIEQQSNGQTDHLMRYESVIIKMSQISENSSKDSNLYCELYLYLCEFARNLLEQSSNKRLEEQQFADNKITLLENKLASVKSTLEEQKVNHEEEMMQVKKRLSQLQYFNSRQEHQKHAKSLQEILSLRSTIKDLIAQLSQLKEILHANEYQIMMSRQRQQLKNSQISSLTQRITQRQRQICEKDEQVNILTSRHRIIKRQYDVIKQRYEDNIEENLEMRAAIDKLESQISQIEDRKYSQLGTDFQVQELRRNLKLAEQANKNLSRLLKDQQTTFQAIIKTPQNMNYNAMKINFDLQRTLQDNLQQKMQQISNIMENCSRMTCSKCSSSFPPLYAKEHFHRCSNNITDIAFDVSYSYSPEGEFLFQISINREETNEIIHRSISDVRQLLTLLACDQSFIGLFQQCEDDSTENERMRQHLDDFLNTSKENPCLSLSTFLALRMIS